MAVLNTTSPATGLSYPKLFPLNSVPSCRTSVTSSIFLILKKKGLRTTLNPFPNYLRILYNSEVNEIKIDVAENHNVVILPTLEFCAFTLFGVT